MVGHLPKLSKSTMLTSFQAFTPTSSHQVGLEMFQKGQTRQFFASQAQAPRPLSEATEIYDTDFEEDFSDLEDMSGRRSVESVSYFFDISLGKTPYSVFGSLARQVIPPFHHMTNYKHQSQMASVASTSKWANQSRCKAP